MKKIFFLTGLFLVLALQAQVQRFTYEYKFAIDSTRKDSLMSELMNLDIQKSGSVYYSKAKQDSDSIVNAEVRKQIKMGTSDIQMKSGYKGIVNFSVEKSYPEYKTYLLTNIGSMNRASKYRVLDNRKIEWKILPEKKKIGNFETQKAETTFAGRQWVAWFTTEIPFQDGPYKFHGLPGLIVKLQSADNTYFMELKGIKKITEAPVNAVTTPDLPVLRNKILEISQSEYAKLMDQYRKDPAQSIRELLNRPGIKVRINVNGNEVSDTHDIIRHIEKSEKEKLRKENNEIERKLN